MVRMMTSDKALKIFAAIVTAIALSSLILTIQSCVAFTELTEYVCTTEKGTWVNIRSAPEDGAPIVGQMRYGYRMNGIPEGNWIRFYKNGEERYVRTRYFETPRRCRCVVTKKVNKRASPNGEVLGQLNKGVWIDIFAVTRTDDGKLWGRGYGNVYIQMDYLKVKEEYDL